MRYMFVEINDNKLDPAEIVRFMQKGLEVLTKNEHSLIVEHELDRYGLLITDHHLYLFGNDVNRFSLRYQRELGKKVNA